MSGNGVFVSAPDFIEGVGIIARMNLIFFFEGQMSTTETQYMCPDAPRHIVLAEHLQRQRVMIVGDIHGHMPPVCACVHGIHALFYIPIFYPFLEIMKRHSRARYHFQLTRILCLRAFNSLSLSLSHTHTHTHTRTNTH